MITTVTDLQTVPESESTLFEMLQGGTVNAQISMQNMGLNTINFNFQEWDGTAWVDLEDLGEPLNNTLSPGQIKQVAVESSQAKVRLRGNASGASELFFSVQRTVTRADGGQLPLLSF